MPTSEIVSKIELDAQLDRVIHEFQMFVIKSEYKFWKQDADRALDISIKLMEFRSFIKRRWTDADKG